MPWDEGLVNSLVYDRPDPAEGRVVSYAQAINEALALALENDPGVFVLGQGVDDPLAMFGTTRGLPARFGPDRVFDTPLSEEAMMGVSAGRRDERHAPRVHAQPARTSCCWRSISSSRTPRNSTSWTTARRRCRWSSGRPSAAAGDRARSIRRRSTACCSACRD